MKFIDEEIYHNDIGIYQIKNLVNNKIYIGQTKERFIERYWHHQWKLKNGTHDNAHLQKAYNKYGENNFEFSVLEILENIELDEREKYWISYYRSLGLSYNIQEGGQPKRLVDFRTPESYIASGEKNRKHLLGRKHTQSTKDKMSLTKKGKHPIRKNDGLTLEQAKKIKEMLVSGYKPKDIMRELNIIYRYINGIISKNYYSAVKVDGWEEYFYNKHNKTQTS